MATAERIIDRAFSLIGVKATETPLEASEVQDGLDALNDMLALWDADGSLKGVSPVRSIGDEINAPRYAEGAIKANLAIRLAGEYNVQITASLAGTAALSMNEMLSVSTNLDNVDLPATLPTGSGNPTWDRDFDNKFFPEKNKRNF